jgi:hypothetical protein
LQAATAEGTELRLGEFEEKWDAEDLEASARAIWKANRYLQKSPREDLSKWRRYANGGAFEMQLSGATICK